jgi:hypothetical protein
MIHLTEEQYAAIGRVAVQSGTLEREVGEYITRLRAAPKPPEGTLWPKLRDLRKELKARFSASAAFAQFSFALDAIESLVRKRNVVVHGVWSTTSNAPLSIGETTATMKKAKVRAADILAVAEQLRLARKLLLRLVHDHCLPAAGSKKCPKSPARPMMTKLSKYTTVPLRIAP